MAKVHFTVHGMSLAVSADTPGGNQVDKGALGPHLEAPVQRIFYMSHEGRQDQEVYPQPNPTLLAELEACDAVLYGMGSLYTSICPSLILQVRTRADHSIFGLGTCMNSTGHAAFPFTCYDVACVTSSRHVPMTV